MAERLERKVVSGVAWSLSEKLLTMVIQMAVSIIVARSLSPDDFGVMAILTFFMSVALTIVDSGFSQTLIRKANPTNEEYASVPSITEEMKAGEMFLDNHLPWDNIEPVNRNRFVPDLKQKIAVLQKKSAARIAASPEFKVLGKRIAAYRGLRKKNSVSLNENKRWKDYLQEKAAADAEEKEMGLSEEAKKEKLDPAAKEAAAIAADLYELTNK